MKLKFFTLTLILLFLPYTLEANINDYLVGLKAYKDGFYDLAKNNLEHYIKEDGDEKNQIFAHYILAHIYVDEKNYSKALSHINIIEGKFDDRIDKENLKDLKILSLVNTSCTEAIKYLANNLNEKTFTIYFQSGCKKNDEFIDILCNNNTNEKIKTKVLFNLKNFTGNTDKIFSCFNFNDLDKKDLRNLGYYYYKNNLYDYFWKIFSLYKDDTMVNLALERLWLSDKYDDFLKSFEENKETYKINKINYCRIIKIYNDRNAKYDCNLLDKCMAGDENLYSSKLLCFINNKEIDAMSTYLEKNRGNKTLLPTLCENGAYIITENLYNNNILNELAACKNRVSLAKLLWDMNKFKEIITILNNPITEEEYFYVAIAYKRINNNIKFNEMRNKIKNVELLRRLNNY
jgi:hypothetical protein